MTAERNYKINCKEKTKSTTKLSSGYRINMAADDAANLTISEKMREQIRGLDRGTRNAEDGVSWIQTGEGALQEVHNIMHRMNELTIQSLNDTNTAADKAALQQEFDALQSEIDRICSTTQFNTKDIFAQHEPNYYQIEGNIVWQQAQKHVITPSNNTLTVDYQSEDGQAVKSLTFSVPVGEYTTQELIDEIDDALRNGNGFEEGIRLEYTKEGKCNLNLEDGINIDNISGGLSYLFHDMYEGGSVGALIGTTIFHNSYDTLKIETGCNDEMSFQIQYFDGSIVQKNVTIPAGRYTRQQLIQMLNNELAGSKVEAVEHGTGIKLQSDEAIIDGFKGNMFKIEVSPGPIYSSVFYDNIMYGNVLQTSGTFTGGAVNPTNSKDKKFNTYTIDSTNNSLKVSIDGKPEVDITIPSGNYTTADMANKLNELFSGNGLNATVVNYIYGGFEGLKIVSNTTGINSSVALDSSSSAYNTLFVNREYTYYGSKAYPASDPKTDSVPTFTSGKSLTGSNIPLTITAGNNDKFDITVEGTKYTITLDAGTYANGADIANHINTKLNDSNASAGYKGKLQASIVNNYIVISAAAGSGLSTIGVSQTSGNTGYSYLFVGQKVEQIANKITGKGTSTTPASITTNTPVSTPATFDNTNNKLTVNIDGADRTVTFPTGQSMSKDDIVNQINNQLRGSVTTSNNTFTSFNVRGTSSTSFVSTSGSKGITNTTNKTFTDTGLSEENQGESGFKTNTPATVTIDKQLPANTKVTSQNNQFTITVDGVTKTITLAEGDYSQSGLVNELQNKLNSAYGVYSDGVTVELSNGKLKFTSRINNFEGGVKDGKETNLTINTTDSSFMKELYTTRTPAKVTTNRALADSINIDSSCNKFTFTYKDGSGNHNISLTLEDGTYDRSGIVSQINKQLKNSGTAVTASLDSSGRMVLTSDNAGGEYDISYSTSTGGTSGSVLFGNLDIHTPATHTTNRAIQNQIVIDDAHNQFNISVNGTDYSVTLGNGTYTRDQFVTEVNNKLTAAGAGIKVELSGGCLKYTTTDKGSHTSISMNYGSGGTSMENIYGKTTSKTPGATASFNGDGKLVITADDNNGTLAIESAKGGIFQKADTVVSDIPPVSKAGYVSAVKSYIDGYSISQPVTIDKFNKSMTFKYYGNGSIVNVPISLAEKDYTFDELKNELQNQINTAIGNTSDVTVKVDSSGVRIECNNPGNSYRFSDFSGDFYDKIICASSELKSTQMVSKTAGGQRVEPAFAIGRKDIRNDSVEIEANLNDVFEFDFTYPGGTTTFSLKLDPGVYNGTALVDEIKDKLNTELKAAGFNENIIEVGIGGVSTGVSGSNDANALCLKLSKTADLPGIGTYIIDGVKGSAAFYTFYQSDGKLTPAYTAGSKDISGGLTIDDDSNELSLSVDGTSYTLALDNGTYTADEFINMLNSKIQGASMPVNAKLDNGTVKISYNGYGRHSVTDVNGSARDVIFFQENGETGEKEDINIQLSSNAGKSVTDAAGNTKVVGNDSLLLNKHLLNTVSLGINSLTISQNKYAEKALNRLSAALDKVSEIRSDYGAMQNRLEHAIEANQNTSENTSRAESRIRDTEMASEMVGYSKFSILQQVGEAMMAQANSLNEGVLKLLE